MACRDHQFDSTAPSNGCDRPFLCVENEGNGSVLKAVPVDLDALYGRVGVVTLKNRTISPAAQLAIECATA
jgi:hypothetical protein